MIIRAYELKRGDLFIKQRSLYVVVYISDEGIAYSAWREASSSYLGRLGFIGKNSQERVEYVGVRPKKKKTKPITITGYIPTKRLPIKLVEHKIDRRATTDPHINQWRKSGTFFGTKKYI